MKRYKNLSRKGKIAVWAVAALVVIAIAGGNGGSKEQETAEPKPTTTVEQTTTTEEVTTTTVRPKTTTTEATTTTVPQTTTTAPDGATAFLAAAVESMKANGSPLHQYITGGWSDSMFLVVQAQLNRDDSVEAERLCGQLVAESYSHDVEWSRVQIEAVDGGTAAECRRNGGAR